MIKDELIPLKIEIIEPYVKKGIILDVGCGNCEIMRKLKNVDKYGIDLHPKEVPYTHITEMDLNLKKFPFPDSHFDYVICTDTLEHIYEFKKVMEEISRTIKPDGLMFVSVPYNGMLKSIAMSIFGFEEHFGVNNCPNQETRHINFFTLKTLKELLESNNFIIEETYRLGRMWFVEKDILMVCRCEK